MARDFLWELFRAEKGLMIWVEGTGYYGNIGKALPGLPLPSSLKTVFRYCSPGF